MNIEIQIDNDPPFIPDELLKCGTLFGTEEKTQIDDQIRSFVNKTSVAILHYKHNGLEHEYYCRSGVWEQPDTNTIRWHVSGLQGYNA